MRVIVIGGGVIGVASAALLARRGLSVTLLEGTLACGSAELVASLLLGERLADNLRAMAMDFGSARKRAPT